jgi:O-glycosyl hydrolase
MRKHKFLFAAMPFLFLALLFTACSDGGGDTTEGPEGSSGNSAMPVISIHPTSVDYVGGAAIGELSVRAAASDGGTLAWQWYEAASFLNTGGTLIGGAAAETYTPDLGSEMGSYYYYAVVTNTKEGLAPRSNTSNPARIRVLAEAPAAPTVTVTINSANAQYVRGFGGMSNAFGIGGTGARYMEPRDIDTMFNPDTGLGYNILRIMIWPNPLEEVISGQVEPQMNNQITYLEVVKRVNRYGGYVMASPWTPPAAWKVNGSETGTAPSHLLPQHYADYAQYLANYAAAMARYGAPIYTLAIQNEPSFPASYAGCQWSSQQQLDFYSARGVGRFLDGILGYGGGEALNNVVSMSGEPHQDVTWNNPVKNNAAANALVDIYAYHIYGKMDNAYTDVQQDTDNGRKEVWMTEHNINSGSGLEVQDYSWDFVWRVADEIDHVIRINNSNAFVWWYLKRYYSMVGDNAFGTVNGEVMPRGWVMSHWAKYATDTVRIPAVVAGHPGSGNANDTNATGSTSSVNVKASAYRRKASPSSYWERVVKNQEDSISLVIYDKRTNAAVEGQDIRVNLPADFGQARYAHAIISDANNKQAPLLVVLAAGGTTADFTLPPNSIVSIKFSK